jgi:hypothetical protein
MSWGISLIGKAVNVATALDDHSTKLEGQSKVEFDAALPALRTLVLENFGKESYPEPVIRLDASGTGYAREGEQMSRNCTVKIEPFYSKLV